MLRPLYYETLESSSAKRSRQHDGSDTAVAQPFGAGADYGVIAMPARGVTHVSHGWHSHDSSSALQQGQHYLDVPMRAQNGSKRPYSEVEPISAFDAETSAQRLAYQVRSPQCTVGFSH